MKKLLLSALLFSAVSFCQEVKNDSISNTLENYFISEDKFNGEKTYFSPYTENISITRIVGKKGIDSQFIKIDVKGSTLNYL